MLFFFIAFLVIILVLLIIYKICLYFTNLYRETFVSEEKKTKNKFIIVLMDGIIPENIDYVNEDLCRKILPDCTIKFRKSKINSSKTVNITNDKSLDTKTNKKNVNYVVLYKNDKSNSYKKKFIKKWCNKKMKSKSNYIVIDYNNIMTDFPDIMIDVKNKFNIDLSKAIDLSSLLNMESLKSIRNIDKVMNNAMSIFKKL